MAVLPTGIGPVTGGYNIERSLRFNSADSAYLNRTLTTPTNNKIFTYSVWVKRSGLGANQTLFDAFVPATSFDTFRFNSSDQLDYFDNTAGYLTSTQVFRDVSAWYHIVVAVDTTQATSSNRVKLYVNGTQITAFSASAYPSQNQAIIFNSAVAHNIGRFGYSANAYINGYLTEVNFIDGQALTPSSFGETDSATGVWKPKAYSGTYGTNGFFLKFADNSGTTSTTLGKDSSGNGNNWTPNNFSVTAGAGNDSLVDSPTAYGTDTGVGGEVRGNYATLNPVYKSASQPTISNGNLTVAPNAGTYQNAFSTIGVTTGKWYAEVVVTGNPNSANMIGVSNATQLNYFTGTADILGTNTGVGYGYYIYNGNKYSASTSTAYGNSITSGDIVGIALDLDNGKIWFSKNGTWQASGDPVAGTNAAFTGIASDTWSIGSTVYSGGSTSFNYNFGQRAFAYTAPSGFKALCTTNLPTPTIGATSTTQAGKYFDIVLYQAATTNGTFTRGNLSFRPDFTWIKNRDNVERHFLIDAVRGNTSVTDKFLVSNSTAAEGANTVDGTTFSVTDTGYEFVESSINSGELFFNNRTYVGWNWNAGGSNATNTAGTITSTVRANTTSGFSIVTATTNGSGIITSAGHGLGVVPAMIIMKARTGTEDWYVYHKNSTANATQGTLNLNQTSAVNTTNGTSGGVDKWTVSSTTFGAGNAAWFYQANTNYVFYCFAAVAGYSAFGSYTGNGSTDGPFVYTGFRPRYVFLKARNLNEQWFVFDSARNTYNVVNLELNLNNSDAEGTFSTLDFVSNGFKIRNTNSLSNTNGEVYIYAAFAESPFKYALAR